MPGLPLARKKGCEESFTAFDLPFRPDHSAAASSDIANDVPNSWWYSAEEMKALTISTFTKSLLKEFSLSSQTVFRHSLRLWLLELPKPVLKISSHPVNDGR